MLPPLPQLPGVTHSDVELDGGLSLHVAEAGSGDPVVLLHGWPQHWWTWRHVLADLSTTHRVICPDLRGLGWSDAPASGYEKDRLARDVVDLLDALGLERVALVGHDWGAYAGFLMCLNAPERISRYLAMSIPHLWPPDERPDPRRLLRLWYQVVLSAPVLGEQAMLRGGTRLVLKTARELGEYSDEELETYDAVMRDPGRARATTQYYRTFLLKEIKPLASGAFRARRLTVPTRLLGGARDAILQGSDLGGYEPYADDMAVEWLPGVGHFPQEEDPAAVISRARSFLLAA